MSERLHTSKQWRQAGVSSSAIPARGVLQRKCACGQHAGGGECAACRKKGEEQLQRAARHPEPIASVPPIVHEVLRSPGQPLDPVTRALMEPRFGHDFSTVQTHSIAPSDAQTRLTVRAPHDEFEREAESLADQVTRMPVTPIGDRYDFSNVRIHTDARAAESARVVNALAYTVGRDVVFGAGLYAPQTRDGSRLIAHELTHVVQQSGSDGSRLGQNNEKRGLFPIVPKSSMDQDQVYRNYPRISATSGVIGALQRQVEVFHNEPDGVGTEPASTEEEYPELLALADTVEHLAEIARTATRDQGSPTWPGRTTEVGSTQCNPDTGQPEWRIDRSRIPQCMWPCAEHHEQTHVEFMRMPCERVWLPLERARFWIRIAGQYAQQGNLPEVERATREAEAAVEEGRREVQWYLMYMEQTCRFDEGTAYEAGIEVCDTNEIRRRCTETGELAEYNRQMATWRRFMQNPPNCPAPAPRPSTPIGGN